MKNNEEQIRNYFLIWKECILPTSDKNLFEYFIDLLETPMGLKSSYVMFRNLMLEEYNNDVELFFKEVSLVKERIESQYGDVINNIANKFGKNIQIDGVVYTDCYHLPNGKYLEIDLCDAFTTSMFKYGYFNYKSWENFIEEFSNKKIFKNKNTKILILRTSDILKSSAYLLHKTRIRNILLKTNKLKNILNLKEDTILYATGDSILIDINNIKDDIYDILKIRNICDDDVHLSIFKFEQMYFTNGYYINSKTDLFTNKITYFPKKTYYLPLIYKLHVGMKLNDKDMYYGFNDCILKMDETFKILK